MFVIASFWTRPDTLPALNAPERVMKIEGRYFLKRLAQKNNQTTGRRRRFLTLRVEGDPPPPPPTPSALNKKNIKQKAQH